MEKILSQPPIIEMKKKMKRKLLKRFFINKSADVYFNKVTPSLPYLRHFLKILRIIRSQRITQSGC